VEDGSSIEVNNLVASFSCGKIHVCIRLMYVHEAETFGWSEDHLFKNTEIIFETFLCIEEFMIWKHFII